MSKILNERIIRWKDLEAQLRGSKPSSFELSDDDWITYVSAIVLSGAITEDILCSQVSSNWGMWSRWANYCASIHPTQLGKMLKDVQTYTRNYRVIDRMSYSAFKQQTSSHALSGIFLSPIKSIVEHFLLEPNAADFFVISQHTSFLTRLSLSSIDLEEESLEDWRATETRLDGIELREELTTPLNSIIKEWFSSWFPPGHHEYKHGPGSVAEEGCRSILEKYQKIGIDSRMIYADSSFGSLHGVVSRTNRVVFVPKSITSWRTISMEPAALQWYQQGIWSTMSEYLDRHAVMRKHLRIDDQTQNMELALKASAKPWLYATIDLSAASDSVSWDLVKSLFRGTRLLRYLLASRSDHSLLPNGEEIRIKKFAPMGSAICFPMESIIFCAVCENRKRKGSAQSIYSVYGDDIIVSLDICAKIIKDLSDLGFVVNESKSFTNPLIPFRESCGMDAWGGSNVSVTRIPRNYRCLEGKRLIKSPSTYSCYVELCNTLHDKGYRVARSLVLSKLLSLPKRFRPLFDDGTNGIKTVTPNNHHLSRSYSRDWQETLVHHGAIRSQSSSHPIDATFELVRYYETTRVNHTRGCDYLTLLFDGQGTVDVLRSRPVVRTVRSPNET